MIQQMGFGIVSGVPEGIENSRKAMEKLGTLKKTFFEPSGIWDIELNKATEAEHADTAYSNVQLLPHVDCTYFSEPPGLQFFQIPYHDGEGGETVIVDGFQVGNFMEQYYPDLFNYLSSVI